MKLHHRLHTWAADHFSWIQYPHIRPVPKAGRRPQKAPFFKHQMPWFQRMELLVISLALLVVGLLLLFAFGVVAYSFIAGALAS